MSRYVPDAQGFPYFVPSTRTDELLVLEVGERVELEQELQDLQGFVGWFRSLEQEADVR